MVGMMVGGTNRQQGLDIRHQGVGHGDIAGMGGGGWDNGTDRHLMGHRLNGGVINIISRNQYVLVNM